MISVEEARNSILEMIHPMGRERLGLLDCPGRVLAENVQSSRPVPPWNNSAMDGYALRAEDVLGASRETPKTLRVIEEIQAGVMATRTLGPGEAIKIMTGAPIPDGADAVVLVEETERISEDEVHIFLAVRKGEAIRLAGEDVKPGETVLSHGTRLGAASAGMLANIGRARVYVYQKLLATGEELVDLGDAPGVGQIFNSNSYALAAQVLEAGGEPVLLGIARDNAEDLTRHINDGLAADLLITSGGVSVGDFDLVKSTLGGLGNDMRFWRVRMKPGKPMAFGVLNDKPVFGLPGNPVSTMVSFELFVRPSLLKMQGHENLFRPSVEARLLHPLTKSPERRHYVRAIVHRDGEEWTVQAIEAQGSNILHSMVRANALVVFPEYETELAAGSRVKVILLGETPSRGGYPGTGALLNKQLPDYRLLPGHCA
ncbi:MAG: molybdopterin molybdotransferase MoeA [Nitrospinae bacterium]|nr:molybdopterin molybdotransferase MoeA [Nitrospinota bacterium]